jgi:uncharacterized protein YjbI with pentapeptide repeats
LVDFGKFTADNVHFGGDADFRGTKFKLAFFSQSKFAGVADFVLCETAGEFEADGTRFSRGAEFSDMKAGGAVLFDDAVLDGAATFENAQLGDFRLDGAHFNGMKAEITFSRLKVAGYMSLKKTIFVGPVNLTNAELGGQFIAEGTQFPKVKTDFNGVRAKGEVAFRAASFGGPLSIEGAELEVLTLDGDREHASPTDLSLSGTVVHRKLTIQNLTLEQLIAPSLRVLGPATLAGTTVARRADLRNAHFLALDYLDSKMTAQPSEVRLEGMAYEQLSASAAPNDPTGRRTLLYWIEHAAYSRENYASLESYFRSHGFNEDSDNVFLAMKAREQKELHAPARLASWTLDVLVHHGRAPGRVLYVALGFVIFGMTVFWRRRDVEPCNPEDKHRTYNAFWYSLDLLVPAIDLEAAKIWRPRKDSRFRYHYAQVQRIAGWILIPIGLAAITGIIK